MWKDPIKPDEKSNEATEDFTQGQAYSNIDALIISKELKHLMNLWTKKLFICYGQ